MNLAYAHAQRKLEEKLLKRMKVVVSLDKDEFTQRCEKKSWCYSAALCGQWMVRSSDAEWHHPAGILVNKEFLFENETDALMFQLAWGGTARKLHDV